MFVGEMTSTGGKVVGGEVTCGGKMVGGEFSWWRDDWIPQGDTAPKHLREINHSRKIPLQETTLCRA